MRRKRFNLVVEDETIVRALAEDMIMDAGFVPIGVSNASQGLQIRSDRDDASIVFTDVDLGAGPTGVDLSEVISRRWPEIELIVTSGSVTGSELELPPDAVFLPKPYKQAEIKAALFRRGLFGGDL